LASYPAGDAPQGRAMGGRMRKAVIHIGTEKTGTTSIQASLRELRDALPAHGFAYPSSPGERNHIRLAIYALGGGAGSRGLVLREARVRGTEEGVADWLPKRLGAELAELPERVHTVVFSNEHLHSRIRTEEGVARLKALLDRHFDSYRIVVYLRRQDELAVSRYSTQIKTGSAREQVLPHARPSVDAYFDYAALLDRWGAVFGHEALVPRLFIRRELAGGDVVQDFLGVCGLPAIEVPEATAAQNVALSGVAQDFLRRVNAVLPRQRGSVRPRRLLRLAAAHGKGGALLPPRAAAEAFLARFAAGNEAVRAAFFPERPMLFDADFSRYPERAPPVPPAETLRLARTVLKHLDAVPDGRRAKQPDFAQELQAVRRVVEELEAG
jgi:hypothetical protein